MLNFKKKKSLKGVCVSLLGFHKVRINWGAYKQQKFIVSSPLEARSLSSRY